MQSTQFSRELKPIHDLLLAGKRVRGLQLSAKNTAQVLLISRALKRSGCLYTLLYSEEAVEYRWFITATGSTAQLLSCVEILLGD